MKKSETQIIEVSDETARRIVDEKEQMERYIQSGNEADRPSNFVPHKLKKMLAAKQQIGKYLMTRDEADKPEGVEFVNPFTLPGTLPQKPEIDIVGLAKYNDKIQESIRTKGTCKP